MSSREGGTEIEREGQGMREKECVCEEVRGREGEREGEGGREGVLLYL